MQFLNSIFFYGWPLIALPLVIHLINQRRHKTVEWGAMLFLLSAKKVSRGMAIIKHIFILGARMLAIAGLLFAISRPLATGWFGSIAGGKPETVIVVLDRSASMKQQNLTTGETKLNAGIEKISSLIAAFDDTQQIVLIESIDNQPVEIESPSALVDYPKTAPTDSTADIPTMVQTALEYISTNQTGRTDVWICSDARQNDWDPESSRWGSLQKGFGELEGVNFHVLNFAEDPINNYSVVVNRAQRVLTNNGVELVLDIGINRTADIESVERIPLEITINGARSVLEVSVENEEFGLTGHRIPLDGGTESGWGKVELPADSNETDNVFYFSFAEQPILQTVIVSDSRAEGSALALVGNAPMQRDRTYVAKVYGTDQLAEIDWNETALLIWHARLPQEREAKQVMNFVNNGRSVVFFPPKEIDDSEFEGISWGEWKSADDNETTAVNFWRNEDDLLQKSRNGLSLPVNELKIYQHCTINGDYRTLARLEDDSTLLGRRSTDTGGVYFCSTLPTGAYSSLQREGTVLFAMIHRALNSGADSIGKARQLTAGTLPAKNVVNLQQLAGPEGALVESRPFNAGVYGNEDQLIALNRPNIEDTSRSIPTDEVNQLFESLDFRIIDDQLGSKKSLASEIWKIFIAVMGIALLAEAALCLPPKPEPQTELQPAAGGVA